MIPKVPPQPKNSRQARGDNPVSSFQGKQTRVHGLSGAREDPEIVLENAQLPRLPLPAPNYQFQPLKNILR